MMNISLPTYVAVGSSNPKVLYEPQIVGEKARICILVMHSDANYLGFSAGTELAKRGYRVLCANVSNADSDMETKMLDLKSAVEYLRSRPDVEKIILLGHSGGGTIVSAYQTIAENGVKSVQGHEKMIKISNTVDNMPVADGILLLDSNWGNGPMTLFSIDPAVIREGNGIDLNLSFDIYSSKNGYAEEKANYNKAFLQRYFDAQRERYNRLIKSAEEKISAIDRGEGNYIDDEPFIITAGRQGARNNKLYPQDVRLLSHTKEKRPLLHAGGSITTEIVRSVRLPSNMRSFTNSYRGALVTSARNFLSRVGIRVTEDYRIAEDGVYGIDWDSNITSPIGNVRGIHAPILVMGMTAGWEYLAAEEIYNNVINAADKTLVFVEGATHSFKTERRAEKTPGQFGDTIKTTYDYIDKWISKDGRFD